jgi:hypothetical protein
MYNISTSLVNIVLVAQVLCACTNYNNSNMHIVVVEGCKTQSALSAEVGDTIVVKLVQYPGRGSLWAMKSIPHGAREGIEFIGKSTVDDPQSLDNGSQQVLFTFVVKHPTVFKFLFEEVYPYNLYAPPRNKCSLELRAK